MEQYLNITPGSVSVLGLMNDPENKDPAAHRQRYPGEPSLLRMSSMYQHLQPEIPHRRPVKQDPPCYPP